MYARQKRAVGVACQDPCTDRLWTKTLKLRVPFAGTTWPVSYWWLRAFFFLLLPCNRPFSRCDQKAGKTVSVTMVTVSVTLTCSKCLWRIWCMKLEFHSNRDEGSNCGGVGQSVRWSSLVPVLGNLRPAALKRACISTYSDETNASSAAVLHLCLYRSMTVQTGSERVNPKCEVSTETC